MVDTNQNGKFAHSLESEQATPQKGTVGSHMRKNKKQIEMIHINDIRPNKLNFFHINEEDVKSLADELEKNGVNNGRVYYQEGEDGKHYTLIGGETRYHALNLLFQEGKHDGMFPMYVIEQTPEDEISELELIMSDNHQRNFSEEDKRIIIQNYEKIYKYHKLKDKELDKAIKNAENPMQVTILEEQRRIPKGMEKRDWIAQKTGFTNRNGTPLTGRQIQTYLTGEFSGKAQETKPKEKVVSQEELEQKEVLGTLKKYLVEITDAKISITPTKLSIGYANLYDLNRILQTLKTDNELDHITKTYLKTKRG